ncbi:MAG TPA: NAD(P)-dependent oxidoreductase [Candidatus Brocadiia bacterium]|nr:NAD(P)-dependent oxidoreductase [Candidatus Brocadiia bacterium]
MALPRVLCMHDVSAYPESLDPLRGVAEVVCEKADQARLVEIIGEFDAYVASLHVRVNADVLANARRLKVIATSSTGLDHLDVELCGRKGVEILSLKHDTDFLKDITSTAELAFGLLLGVVRRIPWAFDAAKQGFWARDVFRGHQLSGKTYGVLGVGRLGTISAQYAQAFRMKVLGCDLKRIELPFVEQVDLDTLLRRSDIVTIHVHLSDETRGMIGRREFGLMKPGAVLINTSRGAIVDEGAMVEALESGRLAGAGVDVIDGEWDKDLYNHPLIRYARTHDNLLIVPHVGGVTLEAQAAAIRHTAEKLRRFLAGGERR